MVRCSNPIPFSRNPVADEMCTLGPIVRVSPEEVHVIEPEEYNNLFVTGAVRKTNSYARFANGSGFEGTSP